MLTKEEILDNPSLARFVDKLDENIQFMLINESTDNLKYINKPTKYAKLLYNYHIKCLDIDSIIVDIFDKHRKLPEEFIFALIEYDAEGVKLLKNKTESNLKRAILANHSSMRYMRQPSYDLQLFAVGINPDVIGLIKNPSEELQLKAVMQNGNVLCQIKHPTEKVIIEAIKEHSSAIEYVKNPSKEIQLLSIRNDSENLRYIKNPSIDIQIEAISLSGLAIEYVKNPSKELQLLAINQDIDSFEYIEKPDEDIKKIVIESRMGDTIGKFVEMNINNKICLNCEAICAYKFSDGLFDGCPRFLEHVTFQKKEK